MIVGTGVLLVAAAAGYWVVLQAEGRKRGLRRLGRWLGGAVIAISLLGTLCQLACCVTGKSCPMMGGGKAWCPMMGSRATTPPAALP